MTILFLRSGLGNQLFEFSQAYYIMQQRNEKKLYINISSYKNEPDGRSVEITGMNLPKNIKFLSPAASKWFEFVFLVKFALASLNNKICKKNTDSYTKYGIMREMYEYNPVVPKNKILILRGFYQNHNYPDRVPVDTLQNWYSPKNELKDYQKEFVGNLKSENSVCVHIRRGDYVSNPNWSKGLNICDEAYFTRAIEKIKNQVENPVFYCFTNDENDAAWIRENYHFPCELNFITFERTDLEEFEIMKSCRHFILSNSSFSWWAAYLSDSMNKKIILPSVWNRAVEDCSGMYPDGWENIEIGE